MMSLDRLIPEPRLDELDEIDLDLPAAEAWELVRHFDFASLVLVRALFALRALPARVLGRAQVPLRFSMDGFVSSEAKPGFQLLSEDAPRELAVGAIGKVWQPDIPFLHVGDADAFAAFAEEDYVKVAWALRLTPRGSRKTGLELELRVDATDDEAWRKFRSYYRLIGTGSRFIRWLLLRRLARESRTFVSGLQRVVLVGKASHHLSSRGG